MDVLRFLIGPRGLFLEVLAGIDFTLPHAERIDAFAGTRPRWMPIVASNSAGSRLFLEIFDPPPPLVIARSARGRHSEFTARVTSEDVRTFISFTQSLHGPTRIILDVSESLALIKRLRRAGTK